jgi:hypothetical protein
MGNKTHPPGQLRAEKLHQHRKNFRLDDPLHWEDNSTLLMARNSLPYAGGVARGFVDVVNELDRSIAVYDLRGAASPSR